MKTKSKSKSKKIKKVKKELVHHPDHYNKHPSGVECIEVIQWFNFNRGTAIKHIWRAGEKVEGLKGELQDIEKAREYLGFEIDRLKQLIDEEDED